jgi:hypothetical protein
MPLHAKVFYFTSATTVRQLLEILIRAKKRNKREKMVRNEDKRNHTLLNIMGLFKYITILLS